MEDGPSWKWGLRWPQHKLGDLSLFPSVFSFSSGMITEGWMPVNHVKEINQSYLSSPSQGLTVGNSSRAQEGPLAALRSLFMFGDKTTQRQMQRWEGAPLPGKRQADCPGRGWGTPLRFHGRVCLSFLPGKVHSDLQEMTLGKTSLFPIPPTHSSFSGK